MNDPTNGPVIEDIEVTTEIIKQLVSANKMCHATHVLYLLNEWQRSAGFAKGVLEGLKFMKELEK